MGIMWADLHPTGSGLWGQSVWAALSGFCCGLIPGTTASCGPLPFHSTPLSADSTWGQPARCSRFRASTAVKVKLGWSSDPLPAGR